VFRGFLKGKKIMRSRKGFTLIELMIVIVIVAILAAIIVPLLLSRVQEAKYSEGKAILSQVSTVVRAHAAENGSGTYTLAAMGFKANELDSKYFDQDDIGPATGISITVNTDGTLTYTITIKSSKDSDLTDTITYQCTNNNSTITRGSSST
jgi:prepilin-type N-terminal cleavage/methylation domain-containing protein